MHEILLAYVFEKNFKNCMRSQNFILDKLNWIPANIKIIIDF